MSNANPGGESGFAGLGALNELLMPIYRRKRQTVENRAIARARGHFQRREGYLDLDLHGELEFASLKARNALLSPKN